MVGSDDVRPRLQLQRAGMVETLRALADEVAGLSEEQIARAAPRLRRALDALAEAVARARAAPARPRRPGSARPGPVSKP
jgi:hypothetical protein